jgi:rhodanese-related sulfurtransferase
MKNLTMNRFTLRFAVLVLVGLLAGTAVAASSQSAPQATSSLSAPEAMDKLQAKEVTLVDIRTPREWRQTGVASGALRLDMTSKSFLQDLLAAVDGDRNAPIVLICRTGNRTGYVMGELQKRGFTNVSHIAEGMAGSAAGPGWLKRGLPVESCGRDC